MDVTQGSIKEEKKQQQLARKKERKKKEKKEAQHRQILKIQRRGRIPRWDRHDRTL